MNWYIGQDIVCIKSHGHRLLQVDKVYTVNAIRKTPCKCRGIDLDVGLSLNSTDVICIVCGYTEIASDLTFWVDQKCFVPLDSIANIEELTEVLNEPVFK